MITEQEQKELSEALEHEPKKGYLASPQLTVQT